MSILVRMLYIVNRLVYFGSTLLTFHRLPTIIQASSYFQKFLLTKHQLKDACPSRSFRHSHRARVIECVFKHFQNFFLIFCAKVTLSMDC